MEPTRDVSEKALALMQQIKNFMVVHLAKNDRALVEILPGLYIGSIASSIFSKGLKASGITHVVGAIKGLKPTHVCETFITLLIVMDQVLDCSIIRHGRREY